MQSYILNYSKLKSQKLLELHVLINFCINNTPNQKKKVEIGLGKKMRLNALKRQKLMNKVEFLPEEEACKRLVDLDFQQSGD